MPISWAVRDSLGQLNVLVARKAQLEIHDSIKPTSRSSDLTVVSPAGVGNPAALSTIDVNVAIKSLQAFLVSIVVPEDIGEVSAHFITLAKQYDSVDHNKLDETKGSAPSTTDKKETIDDKKDATITFLIMDTLCMLLTSVMNLENSNREKKGKGFFQPSSNASSSEDDRPEPITRAASFSVSQSSIPVSGPIVGNSVNYNAIQACQPLIGFAFSYLQHIYTNAVRNSAARLLGILSITFLQPITAMFIEKFAAAKKDQAKREYATYQRAVGFLDFRVNTPTNVKTTLDYLTALLAEMKNVDRGVLRQEICGSVDAIYSKILSPPPSSNSYATASDPLREKEWSNFLRGEKGVEDWNVTYERIYTIIAKWSSKSKHTLFCFETLAHMVVYSRNVAFFQNKKRFDIAMELIKFIKNEKNEPKREAMRILSRNYYNHLPQLFLQQDKDEFPNQVKALFKILLPNKTKPLHEEIPYILELIVAVGKKNLPFFVNEIAIDILKPNSSYYSRQKALLLQGLSMILEDSPANQKIIQPFHLNLGPLVCPYIEDSAQNPHLYTSLESESHGGGGEGEEDKQVLLLRSALKCFPYIRHPKMEHVQVTASAVILLCKHDDREISGSVSQAIQRFIQLDLNQFFLPTLHTLMDLLKLDKDIDTRPDQILKICNTVSLLCNTLADHLYQQAIDESSEEKAEAALNAGRTQFQVTPASWLALREHMESVVLMRLCHYEGFVRTELLRMLQSFSRKCFRDLEDSGAAGSVSPKTAKELDRPYLIDYLLPESLGLKPGSKEASEYTGVILPSNEIFYKPLHDVLVNNYDDFHGIISYAFSFLSKQLEIIHLFLDQNRVYTAELVHEEWYLFFRNRLLFCCLAVRISTLLGESIEGVSALALNASASSSGAAASQLSAQDLALKFTNARPRLVHYQARLQEVFNFYENILSFVTTIPDAQKGMVASQLHGIFSNSATNGLYLVKYQISKDLSQIRAGTVMAGPSVVSSSNGDRSNSPAIPAAFLANYVELSKHLRKPLTDAEAQATALAQNPQGSSKKKRPIDTRALFFHNEFVLHVYASIFQQLPAEDYHVDSSLLTKSLDDYIHHWIKLYEANELENLRNLTVRARLYSATMLGRFLFFRASTEPRNQHPNHMSKAECMRRRGFFFQLLTHLMPTAQENTQVHSHTLDKDTTDSVKLLEAAVLGALTQLLCLDPLQDQALEGQVLYFLERVLILQQRSTHVSAHLHSGVSNALTTFLRLNPKYVHEFIRMSVSESHAHLQSTEKDAQAQQQAAAAIAAQHSGAQSQPSNSGGGLLSKAKSLLRSHRASVVLSSDERTLIHREAHPQYRPVALVVARYYLRALATNWTQDFNQWSNFHCFSLAGMLIVALLSQTSADPESRAIGLLLASELEKHKENLDSNPAEAAAAGEDGASSSASSSSSASASKSKKNVKPIRLYSHQSPFLYIESTISYSHSLASQRSYLNYILPLLSEAVLLFEFLTPSKKECLMRILQPWVYRIAELFQHVEERQSIPPNPTTNAIVLKEIVSQIMTNLIDITRLCYTSSILTQSIKEMWIALLSNQYVNEKYVQLFAHHLLEEYNDLVQAADQQAREQQVEKKVAAVAPVVSAPPTPSKRPSLSKMQSSASKSTLQSQPSATIPESSEAHADAAASSSSSVAPSVAAPGGPTAVVGASQSAVSLNVDPSVASTTGLPADGSDAAASPSPSPSPDAVNSGPAPMSISSESDLLQRQSSTRATLDAGGLARVQASMPLVSPNAPTGNASSSAGPSNANGVSDIVHTVPARPHFTTRNLNKEKALRKLVLVNLSRSPASQEVLACFSAELRSYSDKCPLEPDAFLKFASERLPGGGVGNEASGEPKTITERSAFELMSTAVFENRPSRINYATKSADDDDESSEDFFLSYYPLLLQNAYVLFRDTPEGYEMLTHVALALGLYDYADAAHQSRASGVVTKDHFIRAERLIPAINKAYPELRHAWSKLALDWACNSLDVQIQELAFQLWNLLEDSSFFLGENTQENLVRAVLMLFYCLRRNEERNLKSIISTLTAPTSHPLEKNGWSALVSSGWALLLNSSVPLFSHGLSLLQCMFELSDVSTDDQRKWILSLGRFMARDSGQEVDTAITDVLFKGVVSAQTFQPTLRLMQSLADIYAGATLAPDNKLLVLLMLVNAMHRMVDIEKVLAGQKRRESEAVANGTARSIKRLKNGLSVLDAEEEKEVLRGVDDCVNLTILLQQYAAAEKEPANAKQLWDLAKVFRLTSLSLSQLLPDFQSSDAPSSSPTSNAASIANMDRQLLFKKMLNMVTAENNASASSSSSSEAADPANPFGASNTPPLNGEDLPSPSQLASHFFHAFSHFFSSHDDFQFTLTFFQKMLQHAPNEWRSALFNMLGYFLVESSHYADNKQFALLAELCTQVFFGGITPTKTTNTAANAGVDEARLAEQVAYLLIEKRPNGCNLNRATDLFNFVRPRAPAKRLANASSSSATNVLLVSDIGRYDAQSELAESLARIETHTFPILKSMLGHSRPLQRPAQPHIPRVRVSHVRSVSSVPLSSPHSASSAPPAAPHNVVNKRMSFASLNEFTASALNNHASLPPRAHSISHSHNSSPIAQEPTPPPPNPPVPAAAQVAAAATASSASNPFANDDNGEEEEAPVAHRKAAAVADDDEVDDGNELRDDDDDDVALFAAATRRLSQEKAAAAAAVERARASAPSSLNRRLSDSDDDNNGRESDGDE